MPDSIYPHDGSASAMGRFDRPLEGLARRSFDAGVRLRTLRAELDDSSDGITDHALRASILAVLDELDPLMRDIVEYAFALGSTQRVSR